MPLPVVAFLALYALDVFLLFLYGMNLFYLLYLGVRHFDKSAHVALPLEAPHPRVTVQLPMYNERYVAARAIRAAVKIDYPASKKQIQVLDDSTDDTLEETRALVEDYRARGHDIVLIHRTVRTGHKGGALREGLERATGEFVAVFDADFIPAPDILTKVIPYFLQDRRLGMVQTRWGYLNGSYSSLTRAQAVAVDAHFIVEQVARHGAGFFLNFNGTAGVWRKECILDAGNWQDDTLTEDLDLSYRARLAGWKLRYVKDIVSPSELPVQIGDYKSQQFRWAKGSIQTALKLWKRVLCAECPLMARLQALAHLTYYSVHPLLVAGTLMSLPLLCVGRQFGASLPPALAFFSLLSAASLAPPLLSAYSQRRLHPGRPGRLWWVALIMIVGTGTAVSNTKAVLEALLGRKSEFVRTPKLGVRCENSRGKGNVYALPFSVLSLVELFLALYAACGVAAAVLTGNVFAAPFLALQAVSFGYVFAMSVAEVLGRAPRLQKKKLAGAV